MGRIAFFSTPEPRQFNYTPRYYDERKERLEELYKKYGRTPEGEKQAEEQLASEMAAQADGQQLAGSQTSAQVKDRYVPGSMIHSAYARARQNAEQPRNRTRSRMKKILTVVSILLIGLLIWFVGKGFLQMTR